MQPKEIVAQFIADVSAQRLEKAKTLLAEEGFEYVGPNMRFLNRDDMVSYQFGTRYFAMCRPLLKRDFSDFV